MNMVFNRPNTKKLIEASHNNSGMNLIRLNWLLDNRETFFGCVHKKWFRKTVYIIMRDENEYRLFCDDGKRIYIYLIEDIEEFLDFINIEELYTTKQEAVRNDMKRIMELPSSGVILIQNKKLFLYDFVIGAKH